MGRKNPMVAFFAGGVSLFVSLIAVPRFLAAPVQAAPQIQHALVSHPSTIGIAGESLFAQLVEQNQFRESRLQSYSASRTYELKNEDGKVRAESRVIVHYRAPGTKEYSIASETGSGFIRSHVFKRLLESEVEAAAGRSKHDSSITPANYQFVLAGEEDVNDYHCFVVQAIPKRTEKYLFEGKIWIHATELAIVKIEGRPAKNPSFWIKRVDFVRRYQKVGEFWLPLRDESVSQVRIFGKHVLTIDYDSYQIGAGSRTS